MSEKETNIITKESAELDQKKIDDMILIDDEQKVIMRQALKFQVIPYFPINKKFIKSYILNDNEYPSTEGKISQAATEMKSRLGNLINMNYDHVVQLMDYEIAVTELDDLKDELDILKSVNAETFEGPPLADTVDGRKIRRQEITIKKKDLDLQMRRYRLAGAKNGANQAYREFLNWKETIEEYIEEVKKADPTVTTLEDLDFDAVRCAEMEVKVKRWKEAQTRGQELTPSQKVFTEE